MVKREMETLIDVTLTPEKGNKTVLGAEDAILLVTLHPVGFQTALWMDGQNIDCIFGKGRVHLQRGCNSF